MGELVITHQDGELCCAGWRSVFLSVHLEPPSLASCEAMDRAEGEFARRHDRFSLLTVVPNVPLSRPPTGLSDWAADMMRRYGPQLIGGAVVLGGSGFLPAVARSIVSAATLLSRTRAPIRSFDSVAPATAWLGGLPDQAGAYDAATLTWEIERLMQELGTQL